MEILTITENAKKHLINILDSQEKPIVVFGLKGGGCAGFEYFWEPVDTATYDEKKSENDKKFELDESHTLVLDGYSEMMVMGSTIDYKTEFVGSMLVVENPNAQSACGCGTSVNFM